MAARWDALAEGLRTYGVRYLSDSGRSSGCGEEEVEVAPADALTLLMELAQSSEPRLRHAMAVLFLVRPELATLVAHAAEALPAAARQSLIEAYVAAVYLQRMWRTRLRRYLGEQPLLPPLWIAELGLPDPDERFGKMGLVALAERGAGGRRRAGQSVYEQVARLLFGQLLAERAASMTAPAA